MNISYRWLRALAPTIDATPRELADRLGMLGAPVDELVDLGAEIRDVVVARVEAVRPHPNADRLRICTVDAGGAERLQVVCGAPNVEAGRFYPFAPVGATLPGGMEIRKAKIRGESSEGMLCSARELGLGRDHSGLMTLAGDWETGSSLVDQVGLDDARLLVDVTANRPDLLSHLGVARELAPGGVADIRLEPFGNAPDLEVHEVPRDGEVAGVRVSVEDGAACPRYMAAVVRGVTIGPSPEWLATRLRAVGLRPINNVVDATNYVLHELGQPLHAFDLEKLAGPEVVVRRARAGESIRTLDGVDRPLGEEVLVIADASRPIAVAGVMGGEESEVSDATSDVLLECARFEPLRVRRAARSFGLSTDASYRFERGVDPELQPLALRRVVDLVLAVAGGRAEPVALDVQAEPFRRAALDLRPERVNRLLGVEVGVEEVGDLLRPIGFDVTAEEGTLRVGVPGFRPDVEREVDLIEEVARRRGYDSFPEELRPFRPSNAPEDPMVPVVARVHEVLGRWGVLEARTAGFAPDAPHRVPLLNPLSAEESHLRDALIPGLLRRVEHNWAHGVRSVRLYEVGTAFFPTPDGGLPREELRLAVALTGAREPAHWSGQSRSWDLWDLKALLGELAQVLGYRYLQPAAGESEPGLLDPAEHFHLQDEGGALRGGGGRVTSAAVDSPAWAEPVFAVELVLPTEVARRVVTYRPLPEFPASERDLALLVPIATPAAAVEQEIRAAAGELLEAVWPFDQYLGKGIPAGTRSLAWRLRFRRPERTLTDAEVDQAVDRVLRALSDKLDVQRR